MPSFRASLQNFSEIANPSVSKLLTLDSSSVKPTTAPVSLLSFGERAAASSGVREVHFIAALGGGKVARCRQGDVDA